MLKVPGKVNTNTRECGNTLKVDEEAVQKCVPSIFHLVNTATPWNPPKERPLAFAFLQRETQTRLPYFQVVDRQDGADGSAKSDAHPVETAADQFETDSAVESPGVLQAQLQRSGFHGSHKKANGERNGFLSLVNSKDLPAKFPMYDRKVSAKDRCQQAGFLLCA